MHIICLGDVVGNLGVNAVKKAISTIKNTYTPDIIIVNGENAGNQCSITAENAQNLLNCGCDIITGGNHSLRSSDMQNIYDSDFGVIRPANLHRNAPGVGTYLFEKGKNRAFVINLIGNAFLDMASENPFECADRLLKENDCKNIIIDFHAESSAEKIAFGKYLDGRVSLVFGTHTHVPTADECILKNGTAYITDIGMSGPSDSVIGVDDESSINFMITHLKGHLKIATGDCKVQGIYVETDDSTGKALKIERFVF